jgi:hypothetical protein
MLLKLSQILMEKNCVARIVATSAFQGVCFQFSTTVDSTLRKRGGGLSASGVLIPSGFRSSQALLFSGLSDQAARRW